MNADMNLVGLKKIRAVVADDSPFVCNLLTSFLESDPEIQVIKTAKNGLETLQAIKASRPDVLTLDLIMPDINGLEILRAIMNDFPLPVVVISGVGKKAADITRQAIALGAADFVVKYTSGDAKDPEILRREIISKVKAAARMKTIRTIKPMGERFGRGGTTATANQRPVRSNKDVHLKFVVVGASTGGPLAIKELLTSLNENFSFAMIIVQHMPEGFTATFASQLDRLFPFSVREAVDNEPLRPGEVVIAKGDHHLIIRSDGRVQITREAAVHGYRPSINATMQSAAHTFGNDVTGVILSGMGDDGANGMLTIKHQGGRTFAQSLASCVLETMPETVIKQGIADRVGTPAEIGGWLCEGYCERITTVEKKSVCSFSSRK